MGQSDCRNDARGFALFAGKGTASPAYDTSGSHDAAVGFSAATWDNPYDTSASAAKAPWCAKPNMLVVSDINPSYDSDQLPGTSFGSFSGDIASLNVSSQADTISGLETDVVGSH